uniref:Uncharacterized protein n=1 Tax=Zea mays TaxID=4577 RepID=A0A804N433_MAIZE
MASPSLPRLSSGWPTPSLLLSVCCYLCLCPSPPGCNLALLCLCLIPPGCNLALLSVSLLSESSLMLTRPYFSLSCRVVIASYHELDLRCHRASHVLAFVVELLNPSSLARDFIVA